MKGAFLLFRLSLRRLRLLLGATGLLLAVVQAYRVHIAATIHDAGSFDALASVLPPSVREIFGTALGSIMTFKGIVCWRWPLRWRRCRPRKSRPVSPT
jgi:hypothetical protein